MEPPFDVLIIGGGSAGAVLAGRLTQDPRVRVLLLEAGGEARHPAIRIPAGIVRLIGNPRFDWAHLAEPDPSRGGKVDLWPAGRVLGGSSSINGMLWVRGAAADFDRWAALGNPGWDHQSLLPLMQSLEASAFPGETRGTAGPQHVQPLRSTHSLAAAFIASAEAAGIPFNPDYNGPRQRGVSPPQLSQKAGARWSAADAFLAPARRRANLVVRTQATVTRLLLDGRRVTGAEYRRHGQLHTAHARQTILSAGSLASPLILMRSGIGPAGELQAHGIPVVHALPGVGANLTEHPNANLSWDVSMRTYNQETGPVRMALALARWLVARCGPATSPYPHAVAFFPSTPDAPENDMQLMFGPFAFSFSPQGVVPYTGPAVTVVAALNHPRTRGRLRLRSPDPEAPPIIEHALLADPHDRARLIAACRFVRTIFAQAPLAAAIRAERLPGPACQTEADWEAHLAATTFLGYHPCGTCAMGPQGVVDHQLRVHGIEALRIADASIMPTPIAGNTNAAAMLIGAKAAELVAER